MSVEVQQVSGDDEAEEGVQRARDTLETAPGGSSDDSEGVVQRTAAVIQEEIELALAFVRFPGSAADDGDDGGDER